MVTLSRIIKYGWIAFLRNGWLSVSTISIMILALIVFEGLVLFKFISQGAIQSIQEKIDISVYFKSNVSEDSILSIKRSIEGLEEVKNVEYVSREDALADFKNRHGGDATITQTLDELEENPLLASLNVKAKNPTQYEVIAGYLEKQSFQDLVEKVTFAQNQLVINRLNNLISILKNGGLVLTLFLAFLAIMVTFNTIRLAIFSASEQINIMRLVGASDSFIRGPYIIEGILYGFIAAVISFLVLIPLINFVSPYIANFIPEANLKEYFSFNFMKVLLYQIFFGVGLGIISSVIAIRRYLRS